MYIEKIKSPADLKQLDLEALKVVAEETRTAVLNRVSKHGGHVGPNLGFVEATVALHYVFNAPEDKLVFDVSHQCYPHKVLTGSASGFLGDVVDMNAMYPKDYRFRDIYLLTTAAEAEEETPRRAEMGLTGWIDCYGESSLKGHLFCGGVTDARDIEGNSKLQEAYEMGKGI